MKKNLFFCAALFLFSCSETKTSQTVSSVKSSTNTEVVSTPKENNNETASAEEKLIKELGCYACHHKTNKLVGPSYKDISSKYDDITPLVSSIINGSQGKWGAVAMPGNNMITKEEAELLAKYILTL